MPVSSPSRPTLLVTVIAILMVALAGLQYRWIGELSGFQRQQVSQSATTATDRFARSLDRELERLWYVFRVQGDRDSGLQISRDFAEWAEGFEFPEMVDRVFWVSVRVAEEAAGEERAGAEHGREETEPRDTSEGEGRGHDIGPEIGDFVIREVSIADGQQTPIGWPPQLGALRESLAEAALRPGREQGADNFTVELDEGDVAFVVEQPYHDSKAWAAVVLRRNVLVDQFLPALVRENFGPDQERAYDVCVFDDAGDRVVLYATAPEACPGAVPPPDLVQHLRGFGGLPGGSGVDAERTLAVAVTPTSGSIDAAVAQFRTRNLLFSFGVFLVLAASVATLAVAMRRAQRLAERQIEFVAGVSHELRTPIAGISSLSQNLADGVVLGREGTTDYGERIHRKSKRLESMVERVLHLSAIRSGRYRYEVEDLDVDEIIDGALAALDPHALERFSIRRSVAAGLPTLSVDRRALESAVRNLVGNAMKFSEDGGEIRIAATLAEAEGIEPTMELRIDDDGQGIDAAELEHVFEPFYRGRGARAAQTEGSGLGLSLVKEVVDAHRGNVIAVSDPGRGTSFRIFLPVKRPTPGPS